MIALKLATLAALFGNGASVSRSDGLGHQQPELLTVNGEQYEAVIGCTNYINHYCISSFGYRVFDFRKLHHQMTNDKYDGRIFEDKQIHGFFDFTMCNSTSWELMDDSSNCQIQQVVIE